MSRKEFYRLVSNLAIVAQELKEAKQEREKIENDFMEMEEKENVKQ